MKRCSQSTEVMTFSAEAEGNACNQNQKFGKMLEKGHRSQKSASVSFLLEIKKYFKKINTTYFYFPVFSKRNF